MYVVLCIFVQAGPLPGLPFTITLVLSQLTAQFCVWQYATVICSPFWNDLDYICTFHQHLFHFDTQIFRKVAMSDSAPL